MSAAITALGRIGERQKKALVATGQILQPKITWGGEGEWFTRQVVDWRRIVGCLFDEAVAGQNVADPRHDRGARAVDLRRRRWFAVLGERKIEQSMRVIESGYQGSARPAYP